MRIFLAALTLSLASCNTIDPNINANRFTGPGGKTAYSMVCNGIGQTLDSCYKKADQLCPAGYNVLELAMVAIEENPRQVFSFECI